MRPWYATRSGYCGGRGSQPTQGGECESQAEADARQAAGSRQPAAASSTNQRHPTLRATNLLLELLAKDADVQVHDVEQGDVADRRLAANHEAGAASIALEDVLEVDKVSAAVALLCRGCAAVRLPVLGLGLLRLRAGQRAQGLLS